MCFTILVRLWGFTSLQTANGHIRRGPPLILYVDTSVIQIYDHNLVNLINNLVNHWITGALVKNRG